MLYFYITKNLQLTHESISRLIKHSITPNIFDVNLFVLFFHYRIVVLLFLGPAYRNRTHIHGVEDRCIIHYTNAGKCESKLIGSPTWARTTDILINSQTLYRLSYRRMCFGALCRIRTDHLRITKPLLYQMS